MKTDLLAIMVVALLAGTALLPPSAQGIPAFARRYNLSCTTCHSPFPHTKPYGDDFAGQGFIIKENEKERDYVTAGDPLLWVNKTFPVAVRFDAFAVAEQDWPVRSDLQVPYGLKLLSGGALYKNIGYYFYFFMSEAGEIAGIEDAYLHFDNVFGTGLDVLVGQFQKCDPLMKRELRLTYEDYQVFKFRPGGSVTDLTYDRGIMLSYGIEETGTDLVASITNGNGIGPEQRPTGSLDDDKYRHFGLTLHQSIGEQLTLGGFFYRAKEQSGTSSTNTITYFGPDLNLQAGPVELHVQYLERRDTNPFFAQQEERRTMRGGVALLTYSPKLDRSRWYLTALYNHVDSPLERYRSATLSGTYLLARNLRLLAEYDRLLEDRRNRFVLGLVTAF
ncbi:MAG: hypothetical protein QHJ34_06100 [bacterium]|jgi:hypothetical protein|nr:hypothetical protein [candidate division KSB1 bacterium]MDH7559793.1 hypothetical protein [bacterium]